MVKGILIFLLSLALISCAATRQSRQVEALSSVGDFYAENNRPAEAENYYEKASSLDPKRVDLVLKLADVKAQQGQVNQAINLYKKASTMEPHNRKTKYRLARTWLSNGDLNNALKEYQSLLMVNKKDYKALNGLGVLLDNLAQYPRAQACYRQGLLYAPQDLAMLNNVGVSYALSGEVSKARHFLSIAREQSNGISRPKENLSLVNQYYLTEKNPWERQKTLRQVFLLKKTETNRELIKKSLAISEHWCIHKTS